MPFRWNRDAPEFVPSSDINSSTNFTAEGVTAESVPLTSEIIWIQEIVNKNTGESYNPPENIATPNQILERQSWKTHQLLAPNKRNVDASPIQCDAVSVESGGSAHAVSVGSGAIAGTGLGVSSDNKQTTE